MKKKAKTVYIVVVTDRSLRSFPSTYGPFFSRSMAVAAAEAYFDSLSNSRRNEIVIDVRPLRHPRHLLPTVAEMMGR